MILLDTNVFSEFAKPRPDGTVLSWYRRHRGKITSCTVVIYELFQGAESMRALAARERVGTIYERLLADLSVPPFVVDDAAARRAAVLHGQSRRQGIQLLGADALIAGIASLHRLPLATRNVKDFKATGLTLIDPWNAS